MTTINSSNADSYIQNGVATIPSGITSIDSDAFSNKNLTGIIIHNGVISIGIRAFRTNKLTSVTIPNSVTSIGADAFRDNSLTSIAIGNSVTSIGVRAFQTNQLTSVTIPNSVTSIGADAFDAGVIIGSLGINNGNGTPAAITSSTSGVFQEGVTLTAPQVTGDPDGDAGSPNYSYQWYKNSTLIASATAATYAVPVSGTGTYKVAITYTDAEGHIATVDSANQVVTGINNGNGTPAAITSSTPPVPICFAEGTLILIEKNQYKAIEKIQTGDYIPTSRGVKRIKWVARRHYPYSVLELFPQVLPVRFKQNSISNSVPFSDLLVSQRHGIFVEGKEVGASMLENGISITRCAQDEFPDGITYYHLEFDEQEVIDAQGFTSTSFVGVGNRSEFDNANEFERLYGNLDAPTPINYVPFKRQQYNALCKKLTFRAIYEWKDASTRDTHISTTSNKSSIPQSSTVTIFPAKSSDSAVAAFSSVLARRATVVAATPA